MKKVVIYTTPSCVYCKMLKDFFDLRYVLYNEHDVLSNLRAREEMFLKSHQLGVPVVDIEGEIFVGFNRPEIEKALRK